MGAQNERVVESVVVNLSEQKAPADWVVCRGQRCVGCMRNGLKTRYGASPMVSLAAGVAVAVAVAVGHWITPLFWNNKIGERRIHFCLNVGK